MPTANFEKTLRAALLGLCLLLSAPPARADGPQQRGLEAHVDLQNLVLYRNDSDFDATLPLYSESGRSVGALATVLRPDFTWHLADGLRIFYQAEIGLNYWGKQNPDQEQGEAPDVFVMKHRELWGEGDLLAGRLGFKAGFSRFQDPTGLFLHHWIGVAQARTRWEGGEATLFFGQVPDQVYEGIDVTENNFNRDANVFGAAARFELGERLTLHAGLHNLHDRQVVGQTRWALMPNLRLEARQGALSGALDLALQAGKLEGAALGGGDQSLLAWALQASARYERGRLLLQGNAFALSADDDYDGNSTSRAFLYSGKNRSATLMLTEDEIRDWYDNVDEQLASSRQGFFQNRAGLFVADVKAGWALTEAFRPAVIVGAGSVLNPQNALGGALVGVEGDLVLEYRFSDALVAQAAAGVLLPGKAGSALANRIDLSRADPRFMAEGSLLLHY